MKKIAMLLPVLLLVSISCIRVNQPPTPQLHVGSDPDSDGVFIHVTKGIDDVHEVMMALKMATHFSDSHDVLVYFDIDGVEVVLEDTPDLEMEPFGSSRDILDELVDDGVTLLACPGCLEVAGKSPSDLRSGVMAAKKEKFFDFTDGRILTLDY